MTFKELGLIDPLLKALSEEGYKTPSPIQSQAIGVAITGRDILGCAQTGTGKTAAFALPILQNLQKEDIKSHRKIQCLVLTPTRELALQIAESFKAYGRYTNVRTGVIFGGVSQKPQEDMLSRGIDVLVATPGRLNDLIGQGIIDLKHVKYFVLDEADRMLDMGFVHDVKKIIAKIPVKRQTMFFSATMPQEIKDLVSSILTDPLKVEVTPVSSTVVKIDQMVCMTDRTNKPKLLNYFLKNPEITSALVFTRTKHGANKVCEGLQKVGILSASIHGNKSQNARQLALSSFKSGQTRVLVATDIAARGIDINELSHVFNYDLPNIPETYVHRIGRTGRAGLGGVSISFCDVEEMPYLKDIEKLIGKSVPVCADHPYPMTVFTPPPKNTQQRPPRAQREQKAAAKSAAKAVASKPKSRKR